MGLDHVRSEIEHMRVQAGRQRKENLLLKPHDQLVRRSEHQVEQERKHRDSGDDLQHYLGAEPFHRPSTSRASARSDRRSGIRR
jgi:hypothetical protein